MRLYITLSITLLLTSCATQVTNITLDQDKQLEKGVGYVLLGIETNQDLKTIHISGPQNIKLSSTDIKEGTNYLLVDLKSGIYTIDKVSLNGYWRLILDDEDYWQFEVMPNQISYVGHLELVQKGFWSIYTSSELVNRSSEALEFLEEKYPNLLASRTIFYGGPGKDHFFQFLATSSKE